MSTLWTPGGERPVAREPQSPPPSPAPPGAYGEGEEVDEVELENRMAELREQLSQTPVEGIVAQVAYQLFEIAALHLSLQPPQLEQARLAIDAMAALVDGLAGRVGEHEAPLRDGLSQIRMAFVQIQRNAETSAGVTEPASPPPPPTGPADQEQPQN